MKSSFLTVLVAFLAILMGLYPLIYLGLDESTGFQSSKLPELLGSSVWKICFYGHIIFGGLSLLSGWSQFVSKWRNRNLRLHRSLGLLYLISVSLSGLCGLYLAFFANGGLISSLGFGSLAILWLITTWKAYQSIVAKKIEEHQRWMLRSYALTFAAVTLRLWLPALTGLGIAFIVAYKIISWLSWVPNLLVVEWLIKRTGVKPGYNSIRASKQ